MAPLPCFTYGSLMCEDIMSSVCGRPLRGESASLTGFSRHPVRDQEYPGIRPASGHTVSGMLYRNLDTTAIARLDDFEGLQYERRVVSVNLPDGRRLDADTYVFAEAYRHLLLPGEWDFERFLKHGKARFIGRYVGYQRLPECGSE